MDLYIELFFLVVWVYLRKLEEKEVSQVLYSMEGFYLDYHVLGLLGFVSYAVFCTYGFFFNGNATGKIDLNDVVYSHCALLAFLIISVQFCIYPHGINEMSTLMKISVIIILGFFCLYGILTLVHSHLCRALKPLIHLSD